MRHCKNCEFMSMLELRDEDGLAYDAKFWCDLHEKYVDPNAKCSGKRWAGVGFTRYAFPPWHAIQYPSRYHDKDYQEAPCEPTNHIDLKWYLRYVTFVVRYYYGKRLAWHKFLASSGFRTIRSYGTGRYELCKSEGKDTLIGD